MLAAHIPDNPFIVYRKRTGDQGAVRLSDVTTEREFRNTGLYREFYRPLRVKHSMACALHLAQQELFAIALYRADQTSRRAIASVSSCFGPIWPTCSEASS